MFLVSICFRWLLEKKNVPSVVVGAKTVSGAPADHLLQVAQLEDNLGAVGWSLSTDQMDRWLSPPTGSRGPLRKL